MVFAAGVAGAEVPDAEAERKDIRRQHDIAGVAGRGVAVGVDCCEDDLEGLAGGGDRGTFELPQHRVGDHVQRDGGAAADRHGLRRRRQQVLPGLSSL